MEPPAKIDKPEVDEDSLEGLDEIIDELDQQEQSKE